MKPQTNKLQKVLAQAGFASRRTVEQWILASRITVNGAVAELGCRVHAADVIHVDGKRVQATDTQVEPQVLLYHKPEGEICTRYDEQNRPTVFDRLPRLHHARWISVGRLDLNTSGLLLFTDSGELAHHWMHPSSHYVREYAVRVYGQVSASTLQRLKQGVIIEGKRSAFATIQVGRGEGRNHWYHVTLMEGRHRLVRKLWESQGVSVSRLIRTRFADFELPRDLRAGEFREMTSSVTSQKFSK